MLEYVITNANQPVIPQGVSYVVVRDGAQNITTITEEAWRSFICNLPQSVTLLSFRSLRIKHVSQALLRIIFSLIPEHVSTLNLSGTGLGGLPIQSLLELLTALPKTIRSFYFNEETLHYNETDLVSIIKTLPMESLSFSGGTFYKAKRVLSPIFNAILPTVTHLNLSANGIGADPDKIDLINSLTDAYTRLPVNLRELNLSYNVLQKADLGLFKMIALSPHSNLMKLNLSGNNLGENNTEKLLEVFPHFSKTIKTIDLSNNNFSKKNLQDLVAILSSIPNTTSLITLNHNKLFFEKKPDEIDGLLRELGEQRQRLDLSKNGESDCLRGLLPVIGMIKAGYICFDMALEILSYLTTKNTKSDMAHSFNTVFKHSKPSLIYSCYCSKKKEGSGLTEQSFFEHLSENSLRNKAMEMADEPLKETLAHYSLSLMA